MNTRTIIILLVTITAATAGGLWERAEIRAQEKDVARLKRIATEKRQQWQKLRVEIADLSKPAAPLAVATVEDLVLASGDEGYDERMRALLKKVYELKHWIETTPGENLPEFRFADDSHWFDAVSHNDRPLDQSTLRRAAQAVKERAQFNFFAIVESALRGYAQTAEGRRPQTMADLAPFFVCPVDDAILARYELAGADGGQTSVQERTEGPGQATRSVSVNGMRARIAATSLRSSAAENRSAAQMAELSEALMKYQREHDGTPPKDAEELRPYVKNPEVLVRYRPQAGK